MDTKAEFEKWLKDEYPWGTESLEQCTWQPVGTGDGYYICSDKYDFLHFMFVAWQASRFAIEIELPKEIITRDHGPMISKERTMAVLAYNGIKVKS